jgi:hypothetical protein
MNCDAIENLSQLAYAKFACHYSSHNWVSNEPNWKQMSEKDKTFWLDFIKGVKTNFKSDDVKVEATPLSKAV